MNADMTPADGPLIRPRTLRQVESTSPGVLIHTPSARRLATEQWLLSTLPAPGRERARAEWTDHKVAVLPLGTLFSAVRLPGYFVLAAAALPRTSPLADVDAFLEEVLIGGPVICDPRGHRYYALGPGTMPERWRDVAEGWRGLGVDCLGRGSHLVVPRLDITECDTQACVSYWSVSMSSAAMLCNPLTVARLISAGLRALTEGGDGATS